MFAGHQDQLFSILFQSNVVSFSCRNARRQYSQHQPAPLTRHPAHSQLAVIKQQEECHMCGDALAGITFQPCGHRIACAECAARMKKCFLCKRLISEKVIHTSGIPLSSAGHTTGIPSSSAGHTSGIPSSSAGMLDFLSNTFGCCILLLPTKMLHIIA